MRSNRVAPAVRHRRSGWFWIQLLVCGLVGWCLAQPAQAARAVEAGDLIVANYSGNGGVVARVNPVTGQAWSLGSFVLPTAAVVSNDGKLYVAEWMGSVRCLNLVDGSVRTLSSSLPLSELWGITMGPAGELYLTSGAGNQVVQLDPTSGAARVVSSGGQLSAPTGIALLDATHLVVSSQLSSQVVQISLPSGTQTVISPTPPAFNQPWGIAVSGGSLYVGAHDSRQLQRITGNSLTMVGVVDLAPLGIAVGNGGEIYAGIADVIQGIYQIQRFASDGTPLGYFTGPLIGQATGLSIAPVTVEAAVRTNNAPVVDVLPDGVAGQGEWVTRTAVATDTDWPIQAVQFSLDPGAPVGAQISTGGDFAWQVPRQQIPGSYKINVRATDSGTPPQSTVTSFTVTVVAVNSAPVLDAITNRVATVGAALRLTAIARDTDIPTNTLSFGLVAGAPAGATLTPDGLFQWTPTANQVPGPHLIRVRVVDDGIPSLSATQSFFVTVRMPLPLGVIATSFSRPYGATNPVLTAKLTGALAGDSLSVTASTAAVSTTGVGAYPIVPMIQDPLGRLANYAIQSTNGILTIVPAATTAVLKASGNPVLPNTPVLLTCDLGIVPAGDGVLDGTVQFSVDGLDTGNAVPVVGTSAVRTVTLSVGDHTLGARYSGSANLLPSTAPLISHFIVNTPPAAVADLLERDAGRGMKFLLRSLLSNDSDADGDPLTVTSISTSSASGGLIRLDGEWCVYTPPASDPLSDSLDYVLSDSRGAVSSGKVLMTVRRDGAWARLISFTDVSGGGRRVWLDGIPDHPYRIQFAADPQNPVWTGLISGNTDNQGFLEFLDPSTDARRIYRVQSP